MIESADTPGVLIVILNWNGKADTTECLQSLERINYPNYHTVLVDNGSSDGSIEHFRTAFPDLEIVDNGKNLGYAEGNNVGIRVAIERNAGYVLLLNNDVVVDPDFLTELVSAAMSGSNIGFVGPKVYHYDRHGRKDVISFAGGRLCVWKGSARPIGINETDRGQHDLTRDVDYVEGSCILASVAALKRIGLLRPVFFTYWEDIDWCARGSRTGFRSVYAHRAMIWHKIGSYTREKSSRAYYFYGRNVFVFLKNNGDLPEKALFFAYFLSLKLFFTAGVCLLWHRDIREAVSFFRGVASGMNLYFRGTAD
jgi:GT2 family glycosyltransferase